MGLQDSEREAGGHPNHQAVRSAETLQDPLQRGDGIREPMTLRPATLERVPMGRRKMRPIRGVAQKQLAGAKSA